MDMCTFLIRHVLGVCTHQRESDNPGVFADEVILLGDYHKKRLMERVPSQGLTQLTTRKWEHRGVRIAEDLPGDLSEEEA